MSSVKLLKVKKYLNENLSKKFITSSQILYFFLVLFILKANKDLQFCVNYWKLNVIFKRNKYSLLLINEIINKIVSCKHLTRLNIISAFNKLQMHLNNENYITFITALEAYKLDWSRRIEYSSSSRVLDSKNVESNWNFFEKVSSWIEKLNSSTRVELRSLTRQLNSKTRFDSTKY